MVTTEQVAAVFPRIPVTGPCVPCDLVTVDGDGRTASVYDGASGKRSLQRTIVPGKIGDIARCTLDVPLPFHPERAMILLAPELLAFLRAHGEPMQGLEAHVRVDGLTRVALYSLLPANVARGVVEGALLGNARLSLARALAPVGLSRVEVRDRQRAAQLARWGEAIGSGLAPTFTALEILAVTETPEGEMERALRGRTPREAEGLGVLVAREKAQVQALANAVGAWKSWDAFGPDLVPVSNGTAVDAQG